MNDLWYAGQGKWVVYTEERRIAARFRDRSDMRLSGSYSKDGQWLADQFVFEGGGDLREGHCPLGVVCRLLGFDFLKARRLAPRYPSKGDQCAGTYTQEFGEPGSAVRIPGKRVSNARHTGLRPKQPELKGGVLS